MKAIVLCGGKGTRLKPLTATTPKQLLPVANKPIVYYVMEQIVEAGVSDIGIIVSHETGEYIKQSVGDGSQWDAKVTYILQDKPLGLAHAVLSARDFLGEDDFLMFLGDNLIEGGVTHFVERFKSESPSALILLKKVQDPKPFGVAELDAEGHVISIVEKPKQPKSDLIVTGVYIFSHRIFNAIEQVKPSWRGELEITDSIQKLIDMNETVDSYVLDGWWLDTGKKEDMLEANNIILGSILQHSIKGRLNASSVYNGTVEIGEGTEIIDSIINGPVSIARDCVIRNSTIGPFVCVGTNTNLDTVIIRHSIIMGGCTVEGLGAIEDSIIGNTCKIKDAKRESCPKSFMLGDDSELSL